MAEAYGGKSIWKWIAIYLVVGGLAYTAYYYYAYGKTGGYESTADTGSSYASATPLPSQIPQPANTITEFLGGKDGMTLYTTQEDKGGVSSCYDECATQWPPYINDGRSWPENYSIYTRQDGPEQVVYKGKPLYYYKDDVKVGDMLGHGIGGVWYVAMP